MKFLVDSMLPPRIVELLAELGHDVASPASLGAHDLPDSVLIDLAAAQGRVIVTENARDFANAECAVLLVRKSWWRSENLAEPIAEAIERWSQINPEPGQWAHWLPAELRSPS